MNFSDFKLVLCNSCNDWDEFIDKSPDGNIFSTSKYLNNYEDKILKIFFKNKEKIMAAAIIVNSSKVPLPFSSYQGVYLPKINGKSHSINNKRLKILEAFLNCLSNDYPRHSFCLNPSFCDIRAFKWHNYHSREKGTYSFEILYTGIINLFDFNNFDTYLKSIRENRFKDLKKFYKTDLEIKNSNNVEKFISIYKNTFERQSIEIETGELQLIKKLVNNMILDGRGILYSAINSNQEEVAFNFILNYKETSTYLFGATNPELRSTGVGTALLLNSIKQSYINEFKYFDFLGINSPNRGDFKLSLSAKPHVYFLSHYK